MIPKNTHLFGLEKCVLDPHGFGLTKQNKKPSGYQKPINKVILI